MGHWLSRFFQVPWTSRLPPRVRLKLPLRFRLKLRTGFRADGWRLRGGREDRCVRSMTIRVLDLCMVAHTVVPSSWYGHCIDFAHIDNGNHLDPHIIAYVSLHMVYGP